MVMYKKQLKGLECWWKVYSVNNLLFIDGSFRSELDTFVECLHQGNQYFHCRICRTRERIKTNEYHNDVPSKCFVLFVRGGYGNPISTSHQVIQIFICMNKAINLQCLHTGTIKFDSLNMVGNWEWGVRVLWRITKTSPLHSPTQSLSTIHMHNLV